MLQQVPYYRLPRDEDGRRSKHYDRLFTLAVRWSPEFGGIDETLSQEGISVLRRLNDGQDVSERHLRVALDYLTKAVEYYGSIEEPYPGRNEEARTDLLDLMAEIALSTL